MTRPPATAAIMRQVALATLPGMATLVWFFGAGVVLNVLLAAVAALATEAAIVALRRRVVGAALSDGSALVTGALLGLALPPLTPLWLPVLGAALAIVFGKQLYGGLGFNPFNPAMVGYAMLLIAFPLEMTAWSLPRDVTGIDGFSGATPLDAFKHRDGLSVAEWRAGDPLAGTFAGAGWEWVNLAFLGGGLYLLGRRLFTWHAPLAMLASLALAAALFWDGGSSTSPGSPLFHLFSGATMLGAFFIVTDPVSGASTARGRLLFGAGVGILVYAIRAFGNYPDALAFAVLLMNMAAPLIDHYTRPRPYGHGSVESPP